MIEYTHLWSEKRSKYEYEIDGIVFKLDNLKQRELLGMTAHHPRWALAWKFPAQEAKSVLLDVDWQTGRTGVVTPVGRIAPQMVGGVTVENVTLHNVGELQRLGIRIGDKVIITRRGDVIPKIIENLGQAKNEDLQNRIHADGTLFTGTLVHREIQVPVICPSCPRELTTEGAFLRCTALDCGARTARSLTYWCRSLEMDGIGEKLIQSLLESRLIETIADLYKLNRVQISSLERMGEKSANNVIKELDKTRKLTLSKFLHALGMERIGPEVATVISQHFTNLESLLNWAKLGDNSELTNIDGIGDKVAEILRDGLNKRTELITELSHIIEIIDEEVQEVGLFEGKTFCITGSLSKPRKEITLAIKNVGGKVVSSVSSKLNYLVAGESAGSKLKKAIDLDVIIINEIELFDLISGNQDEFKEKKKTLFDYE